MKKLSLVFVLIAIFYSFGWYLKMEKPHADLKADIEKKVAHKHYCKHGFDLKMEWMLKDKPSLNQENKLEILFESLYDQNAIELIFQPSEGLEVISNGDRVQLKAHQFKEEVTIKITKTGRHYLSIIASTINSENHTVFKTFSIPIAYGKTVKKKDRTTIDASGKRILSLRAKTEIK